MTVMNSEYMIIGDDDGGYKPYIMIIGDDDGGYKPYIE